MTIQRMCRLAKLPRASFYRWQPHKQEPYPDLELRDTIQRIALEFPCYGPAAHHRRVAPPRLGRQSQEGRSHAAGRQLAVLAAAGNSS